MMTKTTSVSEFLNSLATKYGKRPAMHGRLRDQWTTYSYHDVALKAERVAQALLRRGFSVDDKIVIMAKSKPDFAISFFASALCGFVTVPLDIRLLPKDQNYIVELVEAKAVICFRDETEKTAALLAKDQPGLQILVFEDLLAEEFAEKLSYPDRQEKQLTVIAFTSGTVSRPKGVMLTWGHFVFQMWAIDEVFHSEDGKNMLSILPLHHMFEFTTGMLAPLSRGGDIYYADSIIPHQILSFLHDKKISEMLVVPLFLKSLKKGIEAEINRSKLKQIWFATVNALADWLPWRAVRRALFFPLHRKLGGHLQQFISGASSLDPRVRQFFIRMGIDVFEGYGLTETSPIVSANSILSFKEGTVGRALPGTEVKKRQDTGELLVKGPNVMLGYYRDLQSTKECVSEDGWFNTGDVVEIDADGFIKIVGRTKDIIVLGNGKKVVPEEVEEHFQDYELVQEICVVGMTSQKGMTKGTEVVTAAVVPHQAKIRELNLSQEQAETDILAYLKTRSLQISYFKRPTEFVLINEPLPKTSTQKVKRTLVRTMIRELKGNL